MSVSPLKRQSTEPSVGQPSSRRQKLEMSLELVVDDLDGATHARLDAAVLETADEDPSTLSLASFLLVTIVSTSDGRLDSRYEKSPNAKALLQNHPDLMNMLNVAWRDRSFKAIRNLSASPYCDEHTTSNADTEILRPVTNAVVQAYLKTDSRLDTISSTSEHVNLLYHLLISTANRAG